MRASLQKLFGTKKVPNELGQWTNAAEQQPKSSRIPPEFADMTRKDVNVPDWVVWSMRLRWLILIVFAFTVWGREDLWWVWVVGILLFLITGWITYRIYRYQDPVHAEIVFYNEEDGYSSSDGDGDGGD